MTQTEIETYAQVTLKFLPGKEDGFTSAEAAYLDLIGQSKTELEAIEAGMVGQTGDQRVLQQRCWSAQHLAQLEIVKAALAAGVPSEKITAITYRSTWDMVTA